MAFNTARNKLLTKFDMEKQGIVDEIVEAIKDEIVEEIKDEIVAAAEAAVADRLVPEGGTEGQIITRDSGGELVWDDISDRLVPEGGTAGQIITRDGEGELVWDDVPTD